MDYFISVINSLTANYILYWNFCFLLFFLLYFIVTYFNYIFIVGTSFNQNFNIKVRIRVKTFNPIVKKTDEEGSKVSILEMNEGKGTTIETDCYVFLYMYYTIYLFFILI